MAASDPAGDGVALTALAMSCTLAILSGQTRVTISTKTRPPKGFPRGDLLSVGTNGSRNYAVCPVKVMAWIQRRTCSAGSQS